MPNWIYNDVTVSGDKDQMNDFFEKCFDKGGCIDFDKIVPQPKTKDTCPDKYICDPAEKHIQPCEGREWFNWYEWNYDNWGVKWNACDGYCDDEWDNERHFFFETPWSIPDPIYEKLMKIYPKLSFRVDVGGEVDEEVTIIYNNQDRFLIVEEGAKA